MHIACLSFHDCIRPDAHTGSRQPLCYQENQCPQDLTILEDPVNLAKWYMKYLRNANKRNQRAGVNQQVQNNLDPGAGPQQGPPLHPLGVEGAMPIEARPVPCHVDGQPHQAGDSVARNSVPRHLSQRLPMAVSTLSLQLLEASLEEAKEQFWAEWREIHVEAIQAMEVPEAVIKRLQDWVTEVWVPLSMEFMAGTSRTPPVTGNTHVPVLSTNSITALNSAALHHNYASLPAVNCDDLIQELNNEPDADLSSVPGPLFPLGSTPTGPGSPGWSIETHVPHGDKDPVDSQKVFKAPEGWTICAHHPLMVDGDVTSIHALMLEQQGYFAKELSDLQPGYTGGPVGAFKLVPPGANITVPSTVQVRPPRRRSPLEDQVMDEANLPLLTFK
ncbi:hypothetical protein CEUSTIGMA_g8586.t1 [Chlamydomonas eustigma]|uniref:Uncharacterized protein n=1 Tax=Chlamydomonas eustigma TaxID=1157962 RepID=A0A250XDJ2_9CHLO|nr:hypothetical protein CEUSTIGMA_g8586.t1 [Chlamydomonas eustigma]|eukprot:GAX81153.1 hypothetical protein CEUSTIGMA_g8586.t1 [Chlamydomonas eustigma]